jgi:pyruvate dehydrogenase E2 component (dihydrolipoamide acetyltransferase)
MRELEVTVPDIGDFRNVDVIDVLVGPGDRVAKEDPLITLETDKATMDIPAPDTGEVVSLAVAAGATVSEGDPILVLRVATDEAQPGSGEDGGREGDTQQTEMVANASDAATERTQPVPALREIRVPDIGEFADVDVIEVLVAAGDTVAAEAALITLETEKAAMDVPSPAAGRLRDLRVSAGDKVSEGDLIAILEVADEGLVGGAGTAPETRPKPVPAAPSEPATTQAVEKAAPRPGLPRIDEKSFSQVHASPSVRKFAREIGADLGQVNGTGVKSRITHGDVKSWVKQQLQRGASAGLPEVAKVDFASFGAVTVEPLSRIQKISGPRLHASWVNIPHVTQFDEADITDMEARRGKLKGAAAARGLRLTPLAFIMRACAQTLLQFPVVNSSLHEDGESLVLKQYCNIGFAADTPNGLMVPVIRDADKKDVYELAEELATLSDKARDGKLSAKEMQGGTFTVSSLGGIGGTAFTPVINAPEVAILGVSRSTMTPVYEQGAWLPRLMLPLSLSYDHRVIDGAAAVRFTRALADALADVDGLLEAIP